MNQHDCELNALGRIIVQIKKYRQIEAGTPVGAVKQNLNDYLRGHLSTADWHLWLSLHVTPTFPGLSKPSDSYLS